MTSNLNAELHFEMQQNNISREKMSVILNLNTDNDKSLVQILTIAYFWAIVFNSTKDIMKLALSGCLHYTSRCLYELPES